MRPKRGHRRCEMRSRRGSVLYAVLVVIAVGALACTTMIVRAEAQQATVRSGLERMRLRAVAWSGLQGVVAEMESQRGELLDGGAPLLTREWTMWESGGRRGVVRLLPYDSRGEELARSESVCLDVNLATPEMLAKLPGMDAALAGKIVAARGARGLGSPEALGGAGLTAGVLLGDEAAGEEGVLRFLTAFACDVNAQAGVTREGRGHAGEPRVHVEAGWSPEVEGELKGRLTATGLAAAKAGLEANGAKTETVLIAAARKAGAESMALGEMLDVLTVRDDAYPRGLVDVNRASAEVLACLPGLDAAAAERVVQSRSGVSAEDRRNVAWAVEAGLLTPEQFEAAAGWMTTRSVVWRVRIEAAIEVAGAESSESTVERRMVWEAVVDAASPEARVAYLRDVTYLSQAIARVEEAETEAKQRAERALIAASDAVPEPPTAAPPASDRDSERPPRERRRETIGTSRAAGAEQPVKDGPKGTDTVDQIKLKTEERKAGTPPTFQDRRIGRWRGGS